MGNNNIKKLLQNALEQTHKDSRSPDEEKWFTRAAIAIQLKAPSGGLNPSRKSALEQMVEDGIVLKRKQPNTGKQTLEFRLKN